MAPQLPDRTNKPGEGNGHEALRVEATGLEERNGRRNLEASATKTRGVGHEGHERSIRVIRRNAEHDSRPDLRSHPEVNDPYLASSWRPQRPEFSRRSRA